MGTRLGVAVMSAGLALYLVFAVWYATVLIGTGEPIAIAMGVALLVLPVIGAWSLVRELRFGRDAARLGARLAEEGGMPTDEVAVYTSGRVVRENADALFPSYRAAVEEAPTDWRAWYRLGLVYDAAGDRRRARHAIRTAITQSRIATPPPAQPQTGPEQA